jgi:hypothetical protein
LRSISPETEPARPLPKARLAELVRSARHSHLVDRSGVPPAGAALYTLSDPRDVRAVRYVGQTRAPQRRYVQHVCTARLWLPDERPWWVASPALRPLYEWIRALHRDGYRLPVMCVENWVEPRDARAAERALIARQLRDDHALLNVEARLEGPQLTLL